MSNAKKRTVNCVSSGDPSFPISRIAEQMFRIRGISRRFDSQDNDEQPETAATWLAADPEVWYALARRATPAQRPLIRTQLERILGESIVLDAEADGDKLAAQLKTIRDLLDRRKAEAAK